MRNPCSSFAYTVSSNVDLMSFDAAQGAELIDAPLLMIAGKAADTLYITEHVFAAATGTNDKELYLVPGATHIQTYWVPRIRRADFKEARRILRREALIKANSPGICRGSFKTKDPGQKSEVFFWRRHRI